MKLVLATTNEGKLRELRALLVGIDIEVVSMLEALGKKLQIVEDGATFAENAVKKASVLRDTSGLSALADDSGLEVDALGGRPGVYSARFSGPNANDASNRQTLLDELTTQPGEVLSRARFRCVLAWAKLETPVVATFDGTCEGTIVRTPRGDNGFGYDPLFVPDEGDGRTMAELAREEKNRISHRARAFCKFRESLERKLSTPR